MLVGAGVNFKYCGSTLDKENTDVMGKQGYLIYNIIMTG